MDASTSRKLDLRVQEATQQPRLEDTVLRHPRVEDTIFSPSVLLLIHVAEEKIASSLDAEAKTLLPDTSGQCSLSSVRG